MSLKSKLMAVGCVVLWSFVVSCSTLNKKECQTMNWSLRGKSDAMDGIPENQVSDYTKTCSQYGTSVDDKAYKAGHDEGLTMFCTFENGRLWGRQNRPYSGACPSPLDRDFVHGYQKGQNEFLSEQQRTRQANQEQKRIELDRNQCQRMNWYRRGKNDALNGDPEILLSDYLNSCHFYAVNVDEDAYHRGWEWGMNLYCTYDNGRLLGYKNQSYARICPSNLEFDFLRGYRKGQRKYIRDQERAGVLEGEMDLTQRRVELKQADEFKR